MKIGRYIMIGVCFVCMLVWYIGQAEREKIVFIDVGQGDATYARIQGKDMLIDVGATRNILFDLGKIMPIYDKKIEYLILTHFDHDHVGAVDDLIERYQIGFAIFETSCQKSSCEEIKKMFNDHHIPYANTQEVAAIDFVDGRIDFLYPQNEPISNIEENERSIISCISYKDMAILITGDAGVDVERKMLERDMKDCEKSNIVHIGHHGSKTSTSDELLRSIQPEYAIISSGKDNRYGHPHFEVIERISEYGVSIFRTDQVGNIYYFFQTQQFQHEHENISN